MKIETKQNLVTPLVFITIILAVWLLLPFVVTYALFNWTTIYLYSGYSFNSVWLAFWALWTFVIGIFAWFHHNYQEGQQIGAVIAQDIIEERELGRKMLNKFEQEEKEKQ